MMQKGNFYNPQERAKNYKSNHNSNRKFITHYEEKITPKCIKNKDITKRIDINDLDFGTNEDNFAIGWSGLD